MTKFQEDLLNALVKQCELSYRDAENEVYKITRPITQAETKMGHNHDFEELILERQERYFDVYRMLEAAPVGLSTVTCISRKDDALRILTAKPLIKSSNCEMNISLLKNV